ncbi:Autophagy-related protein 11 [Labeo rohita]|uniref:Autophagy-related protein 11 n=1 Tax=Labeo rohita TaxID=84645 RepID=A0ABQ8L851_LABRO|nr:Autophagy-related protein 11 [Labeo rohita]
MDNMKTALRDVEVRVSTWSDEIASLQTIVAEVKTELASLKEKNDDLEGRMRRCNPLQVFQRCLTPKKPYGKPWVIIAKLHYYQDCVEVLGRAREQGPL